jgi:hypothetical protein
VSAERPTAAKERPIPFNGDMVCAILDGKKSQTRRLVKPAPVLADTLTKITDLEPGFVDLHGASFRCPYGKPGDLLWVRETWAVANASGEFGEPRLIFRAERPDAGFLPGWKSPRFMPKKHARLWLEITGVRVERVQDISGNDAIAEGVEFDDPAGATGVTFPEGMETWHSSKRKRWFEDTARCMYHARCEGAQRAIVAYRDLWDSINGEKPGASWEANPWVWVVEFKRVEAPS